MKKGKYKLTVYSDSKDILEQFHSFMVNDGIQNCLIYDKEGIDCFYPEIKWNTEDRSDLDLTITCDFEVKVR